jgi:hypothetical protein
MSYKINASESSPTVVKDYTMDGNALRGRPEVGGIWPRPLELLVMKEYQDDVPRYRVQFRLSNDSL